MAEDFAIESLKRRAGLSTRHAETDDPQNLPIDGLAARTILEELNDKRDDERIAFLIAGLDPSPEWADLAVLSFARTENWPNAEKYFDFCISNYQVRQSLPAKAMALAMVGVLDPILGKVLTPTKDLSNEKRKFSERIWSDVKRRLATLASGNGVETRLDQNVCANATQLLAWLGLPDEATLPIQLLVRSKRNFPLNILGIVELGHLHPSQQIVDKVRLDYPGDLHANILAAVVEGTNLGMPAQAFSALIKKRHLATTDADVLEFQNVLGVLAEESKDADLIETVKALIEGSSFKDEQVGSLASAISLIQRDEIDAVEALLGSSFNESDPAWYRVRAAVHLARGEQKEAAQALFQSAKLGSHWREYAKAADLAYTCKDWDLASECLEHARELNPTDNSIRDNLIAVYERQNRLDDAEILLHEAIDADSADKSHRESLARVLLHNGKYSEALETISTNFNYSKPTLSQAILRSELLRMVEGPESSSEFLMQLQHVFADTKEYWFALMDVSYAAGDDEQGHNAFEKLLQFREQGLISDKEMMSQSIDELKEFIIA